MVGDDIGALADKGQCGIALFTRIEPAVYPDNTDLRSGVDATHAAREGIDALQNFGNGESAYITGQIGLGHFSGQDAGPIAGRIETRMGRRYEDSPGGQDGVGTCRTRWWEPQ